jgi:alanine dehydrogenase
VILLGQAEVEELLDPEELLAALERAFVALSEGKAEAPPRLAVSSGGGYLLAMPGCVDGTLATKLVTIFPENHAAGRPSHQALIAVFDPEDGTPLGVLDGTYITAIRTAVTSALAARLVARSDAQSLLVVGAGTQGRAHVEMFRRLLELDDIVLTGRNGDSARVVADDLGVRYSSSLEEAVASADIVCACTHSPMPLFSHEWLKPGAHVSSVGAADGRELEAATIAAGLLVVESRAAFAPYPAGARDLEGVDPATSVELGELISGSHPGRTSPDEITVFKSVGNAVEDAVAAALVLARAADRSRGLSVSL